MVMVIECFWETYFDLNTFEEDVSHVLEFFWEWSFDTDTFEADWSHSSDAGQSFDIECKFEEVFFEFLPDDKLYLLAFNLWVEDEVLKLLEIFECDLPSTDKVYLFGFEFSTPTSSMVIFLEIFEEVFLTLILSKKIYHILWTQELLVWNLESKKRF